MLAEGGGALTVAGVKKALLDPPANSAKEVSDPGAATLAELVASRLQNGDGAWDTLLADLEKECYAQAVAVCSGNQSKMARLLGVSRVTVRDKLDKFGLFPTR